MVWVDLAGPVCKPFAVRNLLAPPKLENFALQIIEFAGFAVYSVLNLYGENIKAIALVLFTLRHWTPGVAPNRNTCQKSQAFVWSHLPLS